MSTITQENQDQYSRIVNDERNQRFLISGSRNQGIKVEKEEVNVPQCYDVCCQCQCNQAHTYIHTPPKVKTEYNYEEPIKTSNFSRLVECPICYNRLGLKMTGKNDYLRNPGTSATPFGTYRIRKDELSDDRIIFTEEYHRPLRSTRPTPYCSQTEPIIYIAKREKIEEPDKEKEKEKEEINEPVRLEDYDNYKVTEIKGTSGKKKKSQLGNTVCCHCHCQYNYQ